MADLYHKPSNTIIEVNGPSHYIKKFEGDKIVVTDELNGRTLAKVNKLKSLGYRVATINYQQIQIESTKE